MKKKSIGKMLLLCSLLLSSMQLKAQNFVFPTISNTNGSTLNATLTIKGIRVLNDYGGSFNFEVLIEVNNKLLVSSNSIRNNTFYNYAVSVTHRNSQVRSNAFNKNWSGLKQVDTTFSDKTFGPYTYNGASPASLGLQVGVLYSDPSAYAFLEITSANLIVNSADFNSNVATQFVVQPSSNQPLAVTLTDFSAEALSSAVNLEWTTSYEKDSKSFIIERSKNGKDWIEIANVASKSDNGVNAMINEYAYVDAFPIAGTNYYRLKMIDYFDAFEYSRIVTTQVAKNSDTQFVFYPNPVQDVLHIRGLETTHHVTITNAIGQVVARYNNTSDIVTKYLYMGLYTVSIYDIEGQTIASAKIVKR